MVTDEVLVTHQQGIQLLGLADESLHQPAPMLAKGGRREYRLVREGVVPAAAVPGIRAIGVEGVAIEEHEPRAGIKPAEIEAMLDPQSDFLDPPARHPGA